MSEASGKVLIIPCSGIGKVYGLMSREAAFEAVRRLDGAAQTLCLALLVPGDEEAVAAVRAQPCVTVDGCPKLCARTNVELAGGRVGHGERVVDAFKSHKGADPGTATELSEKGWAIADEIAGRLVDAADRLRAARREG
ncbi:MAG: putative zinc-binding protein [Chloroflexota bacterium]